MTSHPLPRLVLMLFISVLVVMGTLAGIRTLSSQAMTLDISDEGITILAARRRVGEVARPQPGPAFVAPENLQREALNGGWVPVAPGIDYRLYLLPDPNRVHVARMDRANSNLFLEGAIAQGRLSGGLERVSGMAARYDEALNYWNQTWGGRNDVVVAINGDFYTTTVPTVPIRGQIQSGWYAKSFPNFENGSGFVWKLDRTAFIGECVYHKPADQVITYINLNETEKFQGINIDRGGDDLIIYTPQFDSSTHTDESGVEVLVEMERPTLILPVDAGMLISDSTALPMVAMAEGTVRNIRDLQGDTKIPFDHIVLSATGFKRTQLLSNLNIGDKIGVSHEITHFETDCVTPLSLDWTKAYAAVGGDYHFLNGGVIQPFTTPLEPRTAIAFNDSYIYFIVVDGRNPGYSIGMTIAALANFTENVLEATDAIAQDGGGSSTMVINGQVVNTPSDTIEVECQFTYLPLTVNGSGPQPSGSDPEEPVCKTSFERFVANGMMMVVYQPKTLSSTFVPGQNVTTVSTVNVRLGPGTNYAILATRPGGSVGTVLDHSNGLNGVLAKGLFWWKVDFGTVAGWVSESLLSPGP